MKTVKFIVLIFAVMIYAYSCNDSENKLLDNPPVTYDSIILDTSVAYNTIPENFVGISYEKSNLKKNNFFELPFLVQLYANFNHSGFFRLGGVSVDSPTRYTDKTIDTTLYNVLNNTHINRFSTFLDSIKAKDSSSVYWKIIYALPVAPYRHDANYIKDVHKEAVFIYDSLTTAKLLTFIAGNEPNNYGDTSPSIYI